MQKNMEDSIHSLLICTKEELSKEEMTLPYIAQLRLSVCKKVAINKVPLKLYY